jgi:hypothetical protein
MPTITPSIRTQPCPIPSTHRSPATVRSQDSPTPSQYLQERPTALMPTIRVKVDDDRKGERASGRRKPRESSKIFDQYLRLARTSGGLTVLMAD